MVHIISILIEKGSVCINVVQNNEIDILQYAVQNGILDLSYVQEQIIMSKRKEILEKYGSCIWYSTSENVWYCHIPDKTKKSGRKKVKRKQQSAIEDVVYNYYEPIERKIKLESADSTMTFQELFFDYMEHKKYQVSDGTIKRMMVDWNKYYKNSNIVQKSFTEITKIDVDDFLNSIASRYKPKNKEFKNLCGILKQTFEYAVDAEYLEKNPYRTSKVKKKNILPDRKKENKKEIFTVNEQALLTQEMYRRINEDETYLIPWIILLDFEIGARIGEILALRYSDMVDGKLHIRRQLVQSHDTSDIENIKSKGWNVVDYTKSECGDRWIPLTDNAIHYIQKTNDINLKCGRRYKDFLFITSEKTITEHPVKSQLERSCKRVGISPRSPHKIRKTYASRLYQNGISISDISRLLGHADETTTLKHYIFSMDDTSEVENKVRNALQSDAEKVTKSDQNIIQFSELKKPQKASKIKAL